MTDFIEKSKTAPSNLASLGIYLFNRRFLEDILIEDAALQTSSHDFGKDIIPKIIKKNKVHCFTFEKYWRDVGTIEAYWNTQQEILIPQSGLDLASWGVRTNLSLEDLTTLLPVKILSKAKIRNSIISPGCVIEGEVYNSILSPGVHVKSGARIEKSVVMNNASIGENSEVSHAILDKNTKIGKNCRVGFGELIPNRETPHLLSCGITVFGKNALLPDNFIAGKNCLIYPDLKESDYRKDTIASGDTVKPLMADRIVSGRKFQ
jgi:glucose-1-phosphate adenylyltransferase